MTNLLQMSIAELTNLIKNKKISSLQIVEAHIQRIEKVNPQLNAVVVKCFDEARKEARHCDETVDQNLDKPLFGVPFTVKEILAVSGKANTMSCLSYKNRIAADDATVVKRIKEAGGILLGLTNLPEIAFGLETDNLIYGKTNHPGDIARTPGGSSGGEAAIIASGGSPFGIGSDAGGSIRMPAFYCGIFGHKPSSGLIPVTGHHPLSFDNEQQPLFVSNCITVGPMARSAKDLLLLINIMSGIDDVDQNVRENKHFCEFDFAEKTVLLCYDPQIFLARKPIYQIRRCIQEAGEILEKTGAKIEIFRSRKLRRAFQMWLSIFAEENEQSLNETLANGKNMNPTSELIKYCFGRPEHSIECISFALGEKALNIFERKKKKQRTLGNLTSLKTYLQDYLNDKVLFMPTLPNTAPKHKNTLFFPFDFTYCAIFNALGFPATAIPMGKNKLGLPIGFQAVSACGRDDITISAAIKIEKAKGTVLPYLD